MQIIIFICLIFTRLQNLYASIEEDFVKANTFYQNQKYEKSIQLYESISKNNIKSAPLYYNLGNAYYRLGKLGKALQHFRTASSLDPRNSDIQFNINHIKNQLVDDIQASTLSEISHALFFWHTKLSTNETIWIVIFFNFIFWILLTIRMFRKYPSRNLVIFLGCITILFFSSYVTKTYFQQIDGVILEKEINVYSGASLKHTILFKLHVGAEVQITNKKDNWSQITLSNKTRGWIESTSIGEIAKF